MRKVTFGVASSVDNFIAREDGSVDWLTWSKEAARVSADYFQRVDTVLMGRKTYEVGLRMTKGKGNPMPGVTTCVFSRTLPKSAAIADTEIIATDAVAYLRKLKHRAGKEICFMGGGELARSLFEARLIDEVRVNIHPILLGRGIPLFHAMKRQIDLERIECEPFKNGCVLVTYRVKR